MSWQLMVGASVLLFSVNSLFNRVLMKSDESDPYAQTVIFTGLVGTFALAILLLSGGPPSKITLDQAPIFALVCGLSAVAGVFTFKGFQTIEASEHTILLTSSKIWSLAGAIIILREAASLRRLLGAGIIILAVVVTEWRVQKFVLNRGALYVLAAAAFYALSETYSFYILRDFDSITFLVYAAFLITAAMLVIRPGTIAKFSFYSHPKNLGNILVVSLFDALANLLVFRAYQVGRNALQIGPLLATQTVVTVVLALLILRERDNLPQKITGAITALVGTILIL